MMSSNDYKEHISREEEGVKKSGRKNLKAMRNARGDKKRKEYEEVLTESSGGAGG